jgi:hypothetical protein
MVKPLKEEEIVLTEEQKEQMFWDNFNFESHKWVEYQKGYYECSFCKSTHTSMMPTSSKSFCLSNPYIKK